MWSDNQQELFTYMNNYRSFDDSTTNGSMMKPMTGKYYISNLKVKEVYQRLEVALKSNLSFCLNENAFCSLVVDFDLKQKERIRVVQRKDIKHLVKIVQNELVSTFPDITQTELICIVTQKDTEDLELDLKTRSYKDGIHLYFPNFCTNLEFKQQLYEVLVSKLRDSKFIKHVNSN